MTLKANYYLLILCVAVVATLFNLHQIKKQQVRSNPFHGEFTEITQEEIPRPSIEEQRLQQSMNNEINNLWSPFLHSRLHVK
jgi:hypothetical protein